MCEKKVSEDEYASGIPDWCELKTIDDHIESGGCSGIAAGFVQEGGEKYCLGCEFHENKETK